MAVFTFKFDESYNNRTLVVGGWLADDRQWKRLESRWQKAIAYENRTLPADRQIKRYHAAELNAGDGDFEGWDKTRKNRFCGKLLKYVSNGCMTAAACGIDLKAFDEIFKKRSPPDYGLAYVICMVTLLVQLGEAAEKFSPDARVAMVHDHGNWDSFALQGYNQFVDDPTYEHRERFVSITPLTWQDDVGLQAADLIAYEGMRAIDNELWKPGAPMRYGVSHLIDSNVHVFGIYHSRNGLEQLARFYEEKYGYQSGLPRLPEFRQNDGPASSGVSCRDTGEAECGESGEEAQS